MFSQALRYFIAVTCLSVCVIALIEQLTGYEREASWQPQELI